MALITRDHRFLLEGHLERPGHDADECPECAARRVHALIVDPGVRDAVALRDAFAVRLRDAHRAEGAWRSLCIDLVVALEEAADEAVVHAQVRVAAAVEAWRATLRAGRVTT